MTYRLAIIELATKRVVAEVNWQAPEPLGPGFGLWCRPDSIETAWHGFPEEIGAEFRVERDSVWPPQEQLELFDWYPYLQTGQ